MRNELPKLLKYCVALSFILYTAYFFAPFMYGYIYSNEVLARLFSSPVEPTYVITNSMSWVLYILHAVAAVMVFCQILFSKHLYLIVILIDVGVTSLSGIVTYTAFDMILLTAINMLDAIVLYIMFLRPRLESYRELKTE